MGLFHSGLNLAHRLGPSDRPPYPSHGRVPLFPDSWDQLFLRVILHMGLDELIGHVDRPAAREVEKFGISIRTHEKPGSESQHFMSRHR